MSNGLALECIFGCDAPLADIVFVHGLTGDPRATWSTSSEGDLWPVWIGEAFKRVSIYTVGYPASVFDRWMRTEMDLFERASNILERFAGIGIGTRPIVFVTHSLGGILIKMVLRKSCDATDTDWRRVSDATRLVVFLATPHRGSAFANVFTLLPRSSSHVRLLANRLGFLDDLNQHYRGLSDRIDLDTAVYYEKYSTRGLLLVTRDSADPGLTDVEPVAIDKDHLSICKPESLDDTVFLGVKRHIHRVLRSLGASTSFVDDYSERSGIDRRDLLQKLIDARLEHEYEYANDAQNGFARRYTSTGLLAAAREDHENLLSEIETRFVTHVYHPLICRSASDDDVRMALQERVIDPLTSKTIGETQFPPSFILKALYFLMEQCHIRWDKPT